ncbi:hypothetical protein U1Q18_031574 [Sarracenia purpurea var. burkii]
MWVPIPPAKTTTNRQPKTSVVAIHRKTTVGYNSFSPIACFCNSFAGSFSFPVGFVFFAPITQLHRSLKPCCSASRRSPPLHISPEMPRNPKTLHNFLRRACNSVSRWLHRISSPDFTLSTNLAKKPSNND